MGFASFGAKPNPPKKKRKLAGVDANSEGSGSNNTPIGVRGKRGAGARSGLGTGRDEGDGEGKRGQQVLDQGKYEAEGGGGYGGGDVNLQRSFDVYEGRELERQSELSLLDGGDEDSHIEATHKHNLEARERPPHVDSMASPGVPMHNRQPIGKANDGNWDWDALRRGVRDENGDMAYYKASFVEDPWRKLHPQT